MDDVHGNIGVVYDCIERMISENGYAPLTVHCKLDISGHRSLVRPEMVLEHHSVGSAQWCQVT